MNNLDSLTEKSHIIYDFDHTIAKILIDWTGWHDGVEKIFKTYDITFVRNGYVHSYQNDMIKKFGRAMRDELWQFNETYEFENYRGLIPNHTLIKFIRENPQKHHHILTSQNRLLLDKLFIELKMDSSFTKIVARDDVMFIKPNTEGMVKIIENNPISQCIYLGDALSDEETANAIGMDFEYIQIP